MPGYVNDDSINDGLDHEAVQTNGVAGCMGCDGGGAAMSWRCFVIRPSPPFFSCLSHFGSDHGGGRAIVSVVLVGKKSF